MSETTKGIQLSTLAAAEGVPAEGVPAEDQAQRSLCCTARRLSNANFLVAIFCHLLTVLTAMSGAYVASCVLGSVLPPVAVPALIYGSRPYHTQWLRQSSEFNLKGTTLCSTVLNSPTGGLLGWFVGRYYAFEEETFEIDDLELLNPEENSLKCYNLDPALKPCTNCPMSLVDAERAKTVSYCTVAGMFLATEPDPTPTSKTKLQAWQIYHDEIINEDPLTPGGVMIAGDNYFTYDESICLDAWTGRDVVTPSFTDYNRSSVLPLYAVPSCQEVRANALLLGIVLSSILFSLWLFIMVGTRWANDNWTER